MTARVLPFPPRLRAITALEIGEQSAAKPLGKFGSALVRSPVREGIAKAERDAANDPLPLLQHPSIPGQPRRCNGLCEPGQFVASEERTSG